MRMGMRKAGVACGTLVTSAVLAFTGAAPSMASSSALVVGGLGAGQLGDLVMRPLLGGLISKTPRYNVEWPAEAGPRSGSDDLTLGASIDIGIESLTQQIELALQRLCRDASGKVCTDENGEPTEKVTVVGLSAGALVVTEVLRILSTDPNAVSKNEITFYVVEDSSRQELIKDVKYNSKYDYTYQPPPEVKYDVVAVTGEFDGFADLPDRPWNFLALANAMIGAATVHVPVMFTNLDLVPKEYPYYRETTNVLGGKTIHYLVPTETLPLVAALPFLKSREEQLRARVEKGYKRYDDRPAAPATVTSESVVTDEPAPSGGTAEQADVPGDAESSPGDMGSAEMRDARAAEREAAKAARAEARAEAKAAREERKAARAEARAEAKAEAKAAREERKAARAEARAERKAARGDGADSGDGESSEGSGSTD